MKMKQIHSPYESRESLESLRLNLQVLGESTEMIHILLIWSKPFINSKLFAFLENFTNARFDFTSTF